MSGIGAISSHFAILTALALAAGCSASEPVKPAPAKTGGKAGAAVKDVDADEADGEATSTATATSVVNGATVAGGADATPALVVAGGTDTSTGTGTQVDQVNMTPEKARLAVNGHRHDDPAEGYTLVIERVGGSQVSQPFPSRGSSATYEGVCLDGTETRVKVRILGDGRTYGPGAGGCFVSAEDSSGTYLGFEESCGSSDWREVDDAIVSLKCPNSKVIIDGVTGGSGVPLSDWLN